MRLAKLSLTLGISCLLAATASAAGWKGAKIMPKSDQLTLQVGGMVTGSVYDIGWPAVVEDADGRWLWLRDEGGYSARPVAGWVYADDVLKLEEARDYYTALIGDQTPAWVYWLRGIYWEGQHEPGIAFSDYKNAADRDPENRLEDVQIRLGRLTAQNLFQNAPVHTLSNDDRNQYEYHFNRVKNSSRPQLYLEWASALSMACKCHQRAVNAEGTVLPTPAPNGEKPRGAADAPAGNSTASAKIGDKEIFDTARKDALEKLATAKSLNKRWWRVPMAEAEMLLDLCQKESADGAVEPNENVSAKDLARAEECFDDAIALNPNSPDAYRDRAEVLRLQYQLANLHFHLGAGAVNGITAEQRHLLQEAKQSATTACNMTLFRQPQCLKVLAEVCGDLQDKPKAAKYAKSAAEYASEDDKDMMKKLGDKYVKDIDPKDPAAMASAGAILYVPAGFNSGAAGATAASAPKLELNYVDRSQSSYDVDH
ncbi:MAG TPA: hypothetical protein VG056_10225 [Pirellulales bacterium]|jgi:tetratricopeptide (TPR) repeat protein|nr:hypothetical protein [Pirellulales bacterium]